MEGTSGGHLAQLLLKRRLASVKVSIMITYVRKSGEMQEEGNFV